MNALVKDVKDEQNRLASKFIERVPGRKYTVTKTNEWVIPGMVFVERYTDGECVTESNFEVISKFGKQSVMVHDEYEEKKATALMLTCSLGTSFFIQISKQKGRRVYLGYYK
jgi:hypothetical protein